MTLLQNSLWRQVSSNRGKWSSVCTVYTCTLVVVYCLPVSRIPGLTRPRGWGRPPRGWWTPADPQSGCLPPLPPHPPPPRGSTVHRFADINEYRNICYFKSYRQKKLTQYVCTLGWVNFSEFEITVCGSCKMSKKTKLTIFNFFNFFCFAKILNPPSYIEKKIN